MTPDNFISALKDPAAWRLKSSALRRSAEILMRQFAETMLIAFGDNEECDEDLYEVAMEYVESAKLLYGYSLETACKAMIVEKSPGDLDIRIEKDQHGRVTFAHLNGFGAKTMSHNLVELTEKAGVFGPAFDSVLSSREEKQAFRDICYHLSDVVLGSGRYPTPKSSSKPRILDPAVAIAVYCDHMLDWLNPILDLLGIARAEAMKKPQLFQTA